MKRKEKLRVLAKVPGVYVPILYKPSYNSNNELIEIQPIDGDIPKKIVKQTWRQNTLSHSTVITPDSAWPNIHMIEIVRSCPELCRFCLASYLNLPFRKASLKEGLIPAVEKGFEITNRIGLLGASITQHPEFSELITWLKKDHFDGMRLSLSSVRASTVNPNLTKLLYRRNSKSITIAIESGSKKIRNIVNKKLAEEEIFAAAKYAKEGGLSALKLYGMVGLPTENDKDLEETVSLLLSLKKQISGLRLTFGVSTFVPKAHTPFQWIGVNPKAKKRLQSLGKYLKPNGINFRPESYNWSIIQALISRSDRRLARVIEAVRGAENTLGSWKKAYKEIQNNPHDFIHNDKLPLWDEVIHNEWNSKRKLPWMHLQGPLTSEQLREHHNQSIQNN